MSKIISTVLPGVLLFVGGVSAMALSVYAPSAYANEGGSQSRYDAAVNDSRNFGEDFGQTVRDAAVLSRPRSDYDPVGARHGSFVAYPYTNSSVLFDDNVYANSLESDDLVLRTEAGIKAESDWGRHMLTLRLDVEDYRYRDEDTEDVTNVSGSIRGRVDLQRDAMLHALFSITDTHESRSSGDAPLSNTARTPTPYTLIKIAAFGEKAFGRVKLKLSGGIERYDYEDVQAVGGGVLDQDSRDGVIHKVGLRKAYSFSPGYNVFASVDANFRNFESDGGSPNRDSEGIEARAGVEFELTRLVAGELSIGYLHQDYDNAAFKDVDDFAFKAGLLWNPTQLMTVHFNAGRVVSETSVSGASGHIDTRLSAKLDYEIRRNLIGSVHLDYVEEDYQGIAREDETIIAGLTLEYLINRRLRAKGYYTHTDRDSTTSSLDYKKNVVGGSLKVQF